MLTVHYVEGSDFVVLNIFRWTNMFSERWALRVLYKRERERERKKERKKKGAFYQPKQKVSIVCCFWFQPKKDTKGISMLLFQKLHFSSFSPPLLMQTNNTKTWPKNGPILHRKFYSINERNDSFKQSDWQPQFLTNQSALNQHSESTG